MNAVNNRQHQTPDVEGILAAYSTVANRVAEAVANGQAPNLLDVPLLAALSSAVQAIGSEYRRGVLAMDVAQGQRKVRLS